MPKQKYILTKDIKKIAQDWEKWKGTTVRPLVGHKRIYEKHFKKIAQRKNPKLLILGATPELRTLGHKYKYEITCVDRSLEMYQAMSLLIKGDTSQEIFFRVDWREAPLRKNYYDLVTGDDVLTMIPWSDWGEMLKKLWDLLKKNGYISTHLIVKHSQDWISEKTEDVFNKYQQGLIDNKQDLLVQAAVTLWDPENYQFSWQKFLQKVKKLKETKKIKNDFGIYEKYKRFAGVSIIPPQKEFERLVKKYFEIISVDYAKEFEYCRYEPVYLLKSNYSPV